MAGQLDLTLPATAPTMAQYHHTPGSMEPAALYTLVDLPDDELLALQHECEIECIETGNEPNASVRPAPQSRFVGQPLRAVFDYHLELGTQKTYDPRYFIVAIDKDWKKRGVLLVTLDDDELECKVDSFRIKASESGLTILNLQIANVNWDEEKENLALHTDDEEGEDDNDDDDPAPKDIPTQTPTAPSAGPGPRRPTTP